MKKIFAIALAISYNIILFAQGVHGKGGEGQDFDEEPVPLGRSLLVLAIIFGIGWVIHKIIEYRDEHK